MIYITGDTHKDFSRFTVESFPEQKQMTKEDYVIICGDFGGIWWDRNDRRSTVDKFDLNWLEDKPFTTLFVDGNHENFDELYKYPVKEWHGGKVHEIRPSVLHLMRGEIYDIEGKKFFAFGGARSHDIKDGIIEWDEKGKWKETAKKWEKAGKQFRISHYSWWEQEIPSKEEIDNAWKNLEKHEYTVDYMITHCCSSDILFRYIGNISDYLTAGKAIIGDEMTDILDNMVNKINYKYWFFGHHHDDYKIEPNNILLYHQIIRIV